MPRQVSGTTASPEVRHSGWSWLLPAGTFLAGCALGAVLVGVGDVGGEDAPASSASSTAGDDGAPGQDDGAATDEPVAEDTGLYVRVPDSCLQTADDATTLVEHVDRVVAAVADLEPERLRQTIDDVQQIRDGVADVADQCRAAAEQRLEDAAEAEDAASATPSS